MADYSVVSITVERENLVTLPRSLTRVKQGGDLTPVMSSNASYKLAMTNRGSFNPYML